MHIGFFFDALERTADAVEYGQPYDDEPTGNCIRDFKKRELVHKSGLTRLRCCVCHLHHEKSRTAPKSVRHFFFKKVLQATHNWRVDVIAGDANAASYRYYPSQKCKDLHNSSVAIMLREMQSEVIRNQPYERRLHVDYLTNHHPLQLRAAGTPKEDLDCCFMAILSWGKPVGCRIARNCGDIS